MRKIGFFLLVLFLTTGLFAQRDYQVQESEDIQKTMTFQNPAAENTFIVDNIFGSIRVEGTRSKDVQISVHKTIKAKNKDRLEKAKEEVSLDITEDGDTIELYVDGPFRQSEDRNNISMTCDPGYEVHYDFDIKVPHQTELCLHTVTDGEISVKNFLGDFDVKNVNGRIILTEISGSGIAHTVNGKVEASFIENPKTDCSFKTLNGDVRLLFQPGLSADFRVNSFTGNAFSDFAVSYLPSKPGTSYRDKGKYVYKSDKMTGIRIGKGGPEIKMDTMNGDILIEKTKTQ
jgi:DUF4097 and DUF4098 domain-containing protein YvlB